MEPTGTSLTVEKTYIYEPFLYLTLFLFAFFAIAFLFSFMGKKYTEQDRNFTFFNSNFAIIFFIASAILGFMTFTQDRTDFLMESNKGLMAYTVSPREIQEWSRENYSADFIPSDVAYNSFTVHQNLPGSPEEVFTDCKLVILSETGGNLFSTGSYEIDTKVFCDQGILKGSS